jgi:glycosyltransferase involved in cell wall biosynthesis
MSRARTLERAPVNGESRGFPLVSVAIPAYRAEPFIQETIRSIAAQDYRPIEVVVVDDCSPDRTAEIVADLLPEMERAGIALKLLRNPANLGGAASLRRGFAESRGEYICWLSADDAFLDPKKTRLEVRALQSTGAGLSFCRRYTAGPTSDAAQPYVGCWSYRFPVLDRLFDAWPDWRLVGLLFLNAINGSSVMITRESIQKCGSFDVSLGNIDQDGDLWLRYSALGARFVPVDIEGIFYRLHPGQTTHQTDAVYRGCAANRLRMLLALEEAGVLGRALRAAWPVLILINRGHYRNWPEVAVHLCRAGGASKPGWVVGRLLAQLKRRLLSEGLWDEQKTGTLLEVARRAMASAEFKSFLDRLTARWGATPPQGDYPGSPGQRNQG